MSTKEEKSETQFHSKFETVEEHPSFSKNEEQIILFWRVIRAFETQLEKTKNCPVYTFYDGPPFATGMPHYGHLIAGGLKDVVTRYWTQRGRYCSRRFGWDCHGLPIETIINKKLNINTKKDLMNLGIEKYNGECRKIVMTYADVWKYYTERYGRWIDFENDYRTLYPSYMETCWWVFKQIFEKKRVYRKCKVMPFSWATNTVLSNFEAGSNYKDIEDPSVIITFPTVNDPNKKILGWTTTPWTLPSNLFLACNPKITYLEIEVQFKGKTETFILAEPRLKPVLKQLNIKEKDCKINKKMKGEELAGTEYIPLFDYFYETYKSKGCFKVYLADYVTTEDGTGIVHNAPGFGEDDYMVGCKYNLIDPDKPLCPIDDDGCFTSEVPLVAGKQFKAADPVIIEHLKSRERMIYSGRIKHSYPFCYRTDTPLIYRAIPCWFIKVEDLHDKLVEINKTTYWVPKYVQDKRFGNWLANAKDWCVSRNRSWGTPIPLWVSDDMEEIVCVGSIEELEKLSGVKDIKDLHREYIDKITIPSQKGKGALHRIEEVFDCWFESGSMPYGQIHYPFEVKDYEFKKGFPADFIAEGIDQTRGWFYTLNVISAIIFDCTPYKNLVVNGLVLDEKGQKLSKSLGNYEDPKILFNKYGADVVRLYLIDSPLVRGQSLRFSFKGLEQKIKDVFLPLYNIYRFLIQNIQRYEAKTGKSFYYDETILNKENLSITDKWIIAYEQRLIKFFHQEMEHYRLYTVVQELLQFLDKLTNWYIRLNRPRIKGDYDEDDWINSLNILFITLLNLIVLLSPFIPFITEFIYQNLRNGLKEGQALLEKSIHFLRIPEYNEKLLDEKIEKMMNNMISVIELGRKLREKNKISLKKPVAKLVIINYDQEFLNDVKIVEKYIVEELNVNEIEYLNDEATYITLGIKPNYETLYKKCKEIKDDMITSDKKDDPELIKEEKEAKDEANKIAAVIKTLNYDEIRKLIEEGKLEKNNTLIDKEQVSIEKKFLPKYEKDKVMSCLSNSDCGIRIDTTSDEKIIKSFLCREIINRIQKLRQKSGIQIIDKIVVMYEFKDEEKSKKLKDVCESMKDNIEKIIRTNLVGSKDKPGDEYALHVKEEFDIGEESEKENINITIFKKK